MIDQHQSRYGDQDDVCEPQQHVHLLVDDVQGQHTQRIFVLYCAGRAKRVPRALTYLHVQQAYVTTPALTYMHVR